MEKLEEQEIKSDRDEENSQIAEEVRKTNSDVLKMSRYIDFIYNRYFSNGSNKYVDEESQYNAYKFLENLQITVCPYCEDLILVHKIWKKRKRRFDKKCFVI